MRVVSVNVGRPQTVEWQGRMVSTAIFKAPAEPAVPPLWREFLGERLAGL